MAIFDDTGLEVANQDVSDETDINDLVARVTNALNVTVENRLTTLEASSSLALQWAVSDTGVYIVDNTTGVTIEGYSARAWGIESKNWANNDQGVLVVGSDGIATAFYSAKALALESEAWANGTGGVSTRADGVTTITRSAREYSLDTAADLVATNADVLATAANLVLTNADVVTTANNIIAAEAAQTGAEAAETGAIAAKDKAEEWSENPEGVEVEPGKYSAFHWSEKAKDYAEAGGGVATVSGSLPIVIDNTDPVNPIVGYSGLLSVSSTYPLTTDNTDVTAPIFGLDDSYMKKFGGK